MYYKRYVDDTFLLFNDEKHIPLFLDYLNSKHENIKFTYETEKDQRLSFLDVQVTRNANKVTTSVFRKPMFTGLGLNYLSFVPRLFKINAIKTLLYRCYSHSSSWTIFHDEIKFLTNFFQKNGYPLNLIQNCTSKFLNKLFVPTTTVEQECEVKYVKLPFYGHLSFQVRKKLEKVLKQNFPNVAFRFIFTNTFTLKSFFPFKDPIPYKLISNIVYQYTCPTCKCRYVGESKRNLSLRIPEHKGVSARTGRPISNPSFSPIRIHSSQNKHPFCDDSFKIVSKVQLPSDVKLLESIYIKVNKPELNIQGTSHRLYVV